MAGLEGLTLKRPVWTLEDRELLPAGAVLSPAVLDELVASRPPQAVARFPFLSYGTIRADLVELIHRPPYDVIFFDQEAVTGVLEAMDRVRVVTPVLESLDYFRRHDFFTYRHILLVYALSTLVAQDLLGNTEAREELVATGPTHDFGKTCVPLDILQKTVPLTVAERKALEHHTLAGHVLLCHYLGDAGSLASIIARDHHERRNGSGYPRGVGQENLIVEIIAVSDIYDALISPRPYRPISYDNRTALEVITGMAERNEISWDVVRALIARNRGRRLHDQSWDVSKEKRGKPPVGNVYGVVAEERA